MKHMRTVKLSSAYAEASDNLWSLATIKASGLSAEHDGAYILPIS